MDNSENQQDKCCRNCGTPLTGETADGLCPRCLLAMNLASRTMPDGEAAPQEPPPSLEEMAERFPQFKIIECLGRGGMGIVYKARQKALDRLVAIKVLAGERRDDPQFEARFSREARTLAKLSHPNIVTVHDFGESDGMFYLVMEYVDGVNLRDVLRDGRMEATQALAIVPEICEALQFAHEHGVVHRDIKPENILMDRDGRVKIADFGIATLVGASGERAGTPPYMAPEQTGDGAVGTVDHRADIYALGVVFYEMLTGERPEGDPTRPSQRVEIDVRLDEIVLRALEKEPEQRYQTAGEFRTVVETLASPDAAVSAAGPPLRGRWRGIDRRSKRTLFGLPLWHVATGMDPATGRMRTARGIVAIGDRAQGVVALGGVAMGGFAFGGLSIGLVSWGGFAVGLLAMGGVGIALIAAFAGLALAPVALGGMACGWYAYGGQGFGAHLASATARDAEGIRFFGSWAVPLVIRLSILNVLLIPVFLLFTMGLPLWLQRRFATSSGSGGGSGSGPTGKRNPWEATAIVVGTLFFVVLSSVAWERSDPFRMPLIFMCVLGLGICALSFAGLWPFPSPFFPEPNFSSRNMRRRWARVTLGSIVTIAAAATASLFWMQRPRLIDEKTISSDSPDGMFSAMGQTWHAMRVFGGDCTYYVFVVQGRGGAVFERWEVPVPTEKLATNYVALSIDDISFARHGRIKWIHDGRMVAFIVNGIDVLVFDTDTCQVVTEVPPKLQDPHKRQPERSSMELDTPEQVAFEFMEALLRGDADTVTDLFASNSNFALMPRQSEWVAEASSELSKSYADDLPRITRFTEWVHEGDWAVARIASAPDDPGHGLFVALISTEGGWRVVRIDDVMVGAPLRKCLERAKRVPDVKKLAAERAEADRVVVEECALRFLVAIREKDEETLRSLCIDRTEGWTDALVGHFSMELRERFRQFTGEDFALYPGESLVDADLAVVKCVAAEELRDKLKGGVLVLYFCRTEDGWKNFSLRNAPASQPLKEHLEQARKLAFASG